MSADRLLRVRAASRSLVLLTALWLPLWPLSAAAADEGRALADRIITPFIDPLFSMPPDLLAAKPLPGDSWAATCPPDGAQAQPHQDPLLSLQDAISLSLCYEPQIRGAVAAAQEQAAAVGVAQAAYLPTANIGIGKSENKTRYPGSEFLQSTEVNGGQQNLGLNWRLFDFGGRGANLSSANATLKSALASRDFAIQRKLATVINAYFQAQTTVAAYKARLLTEELNKKLLEIVKRREPFGMSAQSDVLQTQASLARAQLETQRALAEMSKAGAVLNSAIGRPMGAVPRWPDDAPVNIQEVRNDLGEWLATAEQEHPALLSARLQWDAAKDQVVAAQSEGMPTVDMGFNYYRNGRPSTGLTQSLTVETILSVSINIPLFEGFSRTYKVQAAQARVLQRQANLDDARNQVLLEITKSFLDVQSAIGQVTTATDFRDNSKAAAESILRKYEKGAAEINELLSAQASLSDAELERIRAISLLRSSKLSLFANAGKMGHGVAGAIR